VDTPLTFGPVNRTLTLTGSNTGVSTIAGTLSNSPAATLALTKAGNGTWVLTGANTYTGATAVNAGTLLINNAAGIAAGAAPVTVAGATAAGGAVGTLGGSGGIGAPVTVQAGSGGGSNGVIAPGAGTGVSIGTLSVGGLTLPGTYTADVQSGPNLNDRIAVTGNVDLTGGTLNLPATNTYDPPANNTAYTLLTYTGALTGTFATVLNQPAGYNLFYNSPGQVYLSPTPVPEPAFVLLSCGAVAGVAAWRRRTFAKLA
jgi:fibronectin-binding autotransporter adhesin